MLVLTTNLSHSSEEALRVEETSHPEHVGTPMLNPASELSVSLQQFRVPEPECS